MVALRTKIDRSSIFIKTISLIGIILFALSVIVIPTYTQLLNFFLLLMLAATSEIAATFLSFDKNKIAYEVGTVVSLAAVPTFGPFGAVTVVVVSSTAFWLFTKRGTPLATRKWEQLTFNVGMHSIAILITSFIFISLTSSYNFQSLIIFSSWLIAATIYDQINIWILIVMLQLKRGTEFNPILFWQENRWAMIINIGVLSIGGYLLAFSIERFNSIGIIMFFLPIVLSSLSFRLYVQKMEAHLENLESIIAERTASLSELMKEKDAFLAILTHDMRTPLTSISLYTDLLMRKPEMAEKKPKMLNVIKQSQMNLVEIVNNILDLEKLNAGNEIKLDLEKVDFSPILESVIDALEVQATNKNISLSLQIDHVPILVYVDVYQIRRVLQNLISNAIKYTQDGGMVQVIATLENNQAIIQVKDNGYGIPADELPYIFDRYRRVAKHEGLAVGTGLGLAITRLIVDSHNGIISVESEEEIGSTFTIELPKYISA